ncbi:MAG: L-lactate dehydrogenase [Oscillospiraceae bacterium]|nr:L-lactate dehydrogenase [Oscillospiraceae bacterium]MBQ4486784.1 L-lactate dehydrogenase [Oscillospiraceae bacterium]MCR5806406.1 L-lactate dehydrogenase [Oscillospiraceae bacterium]
MSNKVTIIGAGSVGSTIAYTMVVNNIASEIVLIDINNDKAMGEAMDIRQGVPFCSPCKVYAGTYEDAKDSNVVILTSGVARKAGQSRLDLAQINVDITKTIIPQITKNAPDAIYIIVSNPIDILTYQFHKFSGLPANHIIGSGTTLDTSRLRTGLSEAFGISQQNVHAYVLGEHGDSAFVPWSLANVASMPIEEYISSLPAESRPTLDYDAIEEYTRKSGGMIIKNKGATFYAIAISVCHICKCLFSGIDTTLTVSTMMNGEYGIDDVCLSVLSIVGRDGLTCKLNVPLTNEETEKLRHSAECLKSIIRELKF